MFTRTICAAATVLFTCIYAANAAPIVLTDPSFENDSTGFNKSGTNSTQGVAFTDTTFGLEEIVNSAITGKDGNNIMRLRVEGGGNNTGPEILQTVTNYAIGTFQADTIYTFTVAIGNDDATGSATLGFGNQANPAAFLGTPTIVPLPRGAGSSALVDYSAVLDTQLLPGLVGQNIQLVVRFQHDGQYERAIFIDNYRLDASAAVPEPASLALLTCGGFAMLVRSRRTIG